MAKEKPWSITEDGAGIDSSDEAQLITELQINIYRAGEVGVKITHLPTGLLVEGHHKTSDHLARKEAMKKLILLLAEHHKCRITTK